MAIKTGSTGRRIVVCNVCSWALNVNTDTEIRRLLEKLNLYILCNDCRDKYLNFLRDTKQLK